MENADVCIDLHRFALQHCRTIDYYARPSKNNNPKRLPTSKEMNTKLTMGGGGVKA